MGTVYQPLMRDLPDKLEPRYKWMDILWLVVALFLVFWEARQQRPDSWLIAGFFLSFVIPDYLCRKFQGEQKPQKSFKAILGMSKSLTVICWILGIGVPVVAILAGLGVRPVSEILGPWPIFVSFPSIPILWGSLLFVVFLPVFRVATFIEKRVWLRWVWASAASGIALAILYFQHRMA